MEKSPIEHIAQASVSHSAIALQIQEITELHAAFNATFHTAMFDLADRAVVLGKKLIALRQVVDQDESRQWVAWVEASLPITIRQVQKYIKIAEHEYELPAIKASYKGLLTVNVLAKLVGVKADDETASAPVEKIDPFTPENVGRTFKDLDILRLKRKYDTLVLAANSSAQQLKTRASVLRDVAIDIVQGNPVDDEDYNQALEIINATL
jgi:hypothetical protein